MHINDDFMPDSPPDRPHPAKSVQKAYAKLNLTLNITGKRPDGYHELESVMQTVTLHDDVTVSCEPRELCDAPGGHIINVSVESDDDYIASQNIPADDRNTAVKAAREYFFQIERRSEDANPVFAARVPAQLVNIHIFKRIPAGAGLAGGSADAAAVLLALNEIVRFSQNDGVNAAAVPLTPNDAVRSALSRNAFQYAKADSACDAGENARPARPEPLSHNDLMAAALRVGADVPFCLLRGAALARGVGEILTRLPRVKLNHTIALANPRFEISTAWLYKNYMLPGAAVTESLSQLTQNMIESHGNAWERCFNALEQTALQRFPQIGIIKEKMINSGAACAVMSGSGPTVFGLFAEAGAARGAAERMRREGYWTAVCTAYVA